MLAVLDYTRHHMHDDQFIAIELHFLRNAVLKRCWCPMCSLEPKLARLIMVLNDTRQHRWGKFGIPHDLVSAHHLRKISDLVDKAEG
jgi:hypothetical protein